MTPFERSAAFWLRAYPRRWRAARSAEVTTVLVDLAGTGARRLGPRAAVGLVLGGWATRWREHPPFWRWLMYCLLDWHLPAQFDGWVRDERTGLLTGIRTAGLPFLGFMGLVGVVGSGLRSLGWVTWAFLTEPVTWWLWCAMALIQAVIRTVNREERMAAYFPTPADTPGHFGPYVPLERQDHDGAGSSDSAHRAVE